MEQQQQPQQGQLLSEPQKDQQKSQQPQEQQLQQQGQSQEQIKEDQSDQQRAEEEGKKNEYKDGEHNYQLIDDQINNIQKEIADKNELIGDIIQLSTLEEEYKTNDIFLQKIKNLQQKYPYYRKVRGDGQCFYRSYLFGILERIVLLKDMELQKRMVKLIKDSKEYLMKAGFDEYVLEDFQELFLEKLTLLENEEANSDILMTIFLDKPTSDGLVMYLRFMTSGYLKTNAILFENYILDYAGIDHYCQTEVDPIDREADQIQIMALISYVEVPIKIVYLDQNVQFSHGQEMTIPEDADPKSVYITALYRPGHYDILYSAQ